MDVAIVGDRILEVGRSLVYDSAEVVEAEGLTLSPGFIDVHTHDDTSVVLAPEMLPKLSQVCDNGDRGQLRDQRFAGASARGELPDPMNLLGDAEVFRYPTFADYVAAVGEARPSVNVGALIGHTSLRNNHMDRLNRVAD